MTYSHARHIRMPDLCDELHDGRLEGVLGGNTDVDKICSAMVGCVWRALEDALEVGQVVKGVGRGGGLGKGLEEDARM